MSQKKAVEAKSGMGPDSRPKRSPAVTVSPFGEEVVVFHAMSKQYLVLSGVAARIWALCDGKHTVDNITSSIVSEYVVAREQAAADVSDTVQGLHDFGLVEAERSPES